MVAEPQWMSGDDEYDRCNLCDERHNPYNDCGGNDPDVLHDEMGEL